MTQYPALTLKDRKTSLRILNRMRTWNNVNTPCRLCGYGRDTLSHSVECELFQSIFSTFIQHDDAPGPKLIYLVLLQTTLHFKACFLM